MAAPPPRATCLDLPGAARTGLQLSRDKKTLYYVETAAGSDGAPTDTRDLMALDVATKTPKRLIANVSEDAVVAADGTAVFRRFVRKGFLNRPAGELYIAAPGKDPVKVSDDKLAVGEFAVDDAAGTVAFVAGEIYPQDTYRTPLASPKQELAAPGVIALLGELPAQKAFLVSGRDGLEALPSAAGAGSATPLPNLDHASLRDAWVVAAANGNLLLKDRITKALSVATMADVKTRKPVAIEADDALAIDGREPPVVIARRGDGRAASYTLYAFDGATLQPIVAMTNVKPTGVAVLADGTIATLATNDSDGDGSIDNDEEADVCFIAPGAAPVAMPSRSLPKRFVDVAKRFAALTAGGGVVAGAAMRFERDTVVFTLPTGPADLAELRKLAAAAQAAVTRESKLPTLSVEIDVTANARLAHSRWDANAGTFLLSAGIGTAQIVDATQYQVEVDPHVTLTTTRNDYGPQNDDFGSARCYGTVKNVSDKELADLAVECFNPVEFSDAKPVKAPATPAKLAVGADGKYAVELDIADGRKPFELTIYAGASRLAYVNSFAQKAAAATVDAAVKAQAQTKLAYWDDRVIDFGPSYSHKRVVEYQVVVPAELDAPSADAARTTAATAAHAVFAAYQKTAPNDHDLDVILVLLHPDKRPGWTYDGSTMKAGGPNDDAL
jgi:hypothetical protein